MSRSEESRAIETDEYAEELQKMIDTSRKTVFFGGAGVSTESGIPDFRSADGLYSEKYGNLRPEEIISRSYFNKAPAGFYRFFREKMLPGDARPNEAHKKLAQLEAAGKLSCVITQNIDGLHQAAGSRRVYELHGTVHRGWCTRCGKRYGSEYLNMGEVPTCACGGVISPAVVLYEDPLDSDVCSKAIAEISAADLLIVAGTSLTVYPAAGFLRYFGGSELVLINRAETQYDRIAGAVYRCNVGELMAKIKA